MKKEQCAMSLHAHSAWVLVLGASLLILGSPSLCMAQERAFVSHPKRQSDVAAKGTFANLEASAPGVKGAVDAHDMAKARQMVGKRGAFTGTVTAVFVAKGNSCVILNFDKDYKKSASAILLPPYYADLPDLRQLKGKRVLIEGEWISYQGRPEIQLRQADQVKIVRTK